MYSPLAGVSRDMRRNKTFRSQAAKKIALRRANASELEELRREVKALSLNKKKKSKKIKAPVTPFADTGAIMGRSLGSMFGYGAPGGVLGRAAGGVIGKIFGSGAYSIKQNTLFGAQVPAMHSTSESVTFRHREYIGDISATAAFTAASYPINPGMFKTFPYLAGIASNFQQYRFKGLIFEYKSTSAVALSSATNTSMGTVMMACQYDPNASQFATKEALLNEMWATDGRPCDNVCLPIECAPKLTAQNLYYIRSVANPTVADLRDVDLGVVTVATYGSQVTNVVGELWVSYEVELLKPQPADIIGNNVLTAAFTNSGESNANPLGNVRVATFDNIGITVGLNDIFFPIGLTGTFSVLIVWTATTGVVTAYPTITYVNCANDPDNGLSKNAPSSGDTAKVVAAHLGVRLRDNTLLQSIHLAGDGTLPIAGGTPQVYILVTQLSTLA